MFRMILLGGLLLGVAALGPAAFFAAPSYWKAVKDEWFPPRQAAPPETAPAEAATSATAAVRPAGRELEGPPVRDLGEVFNFNVTADWIARRWPRVTTGLAVMQLQGYRVPLVTGTDPTDLAGSLTYYFNARHQLQRIVFHGTTGDARKLVRLLTGRHKFVRRLTNDPGLFVYERAGEDGKVESSARIRSAPVLKIDQPYRHYTVDLLLERPS